MRTVSESSDKDPEALALNRSTIIIERLHRRNGEATAAAGTDWERREAAGQRLGREREKESAWREEGERGSLQNEERHKLHQTEMLAYHSE